LTHVEGGGVAKRKKAGERSTEDLVREGPKEELRKENGGNIIRSRKRSQKRKDEKNLENW